MKPKTTTNITVDGVMRSDAGAGMTAPKKALHRMSMSAFAVRCVDTGGEWFPPPFKE
jgi:hypothetical protein